MPLVKNDNFTDTIVYATEKYQPLSETFSNHYCFVGPSVFSAHVLDKKHDRPLVYISLGTVVNDKPDFYKKCIEALAHEDVDVLISCGQYTDPSTLNKMAANVTVCERVDQLEVLSRANVFLTHCGMNSVSESLYMGTPMVFFPQTNEQRAVARRAGEMGAGLALKEESAESIRSAIKDVLNNPSYQEKANECSKDFRSARGPQGAAEFIENAPCHLEAEDKMIIRNEILSGVFQLVYWIVAITALVLSWGYVKTNVRVIIIIAMNLIFPLYKKGIISHFAKVPKK